MLNIHIYQTITNDLDSLGHISSLVLVNLLNQLAEN